MRLRRVIKFLRNNFSSTKYILFRFKGAVDITVKEELSIVLTKDEKDLERILDFRPQGTYENIKKLYNEGENVYLVFNNDLCIHHSLVFRNDSDAEVQKEHINIPAHTAWIHYCNTAVGHRGKGIYPYVINYIAKALTDSGNGMDRIIIDTEQKNIPSQKGIIKAGFREMGMVKRSVFFGKEKIKGC